jgi:hypothetical protein
MVDRRQAGEAVWIKYGSTGGWEREMEAGDVFQTTVGGREHKIIKRKNGK